MLTHLIQQSCEVDEESSSERLNNAEIRARQRDRNLNSVHVVSLRLTSVLYQNHAAILEEHYKVSIISSFHKIFPLRSCLTRKTMNIKY